MGAVSVEGSAALLRGAIPEFFNSSGYGSGSGYGYGYGYGYDDGYGDGYWTAVLEQRPEKTTGRLAFWRSSKDGTPSNGGSGTVARVGLIEEQRGPLKICSHGYHATLDPGKWNGERLWIVALHGEIQQEDDKLCALKREFLAEIPW